ncbi:MAG: hypothetical protein M1831_005854 [Alyxoria varia]|nr:MAG: hypothetical protein M1831_005854 [Alyxoria varia]
MLSRLRPTAAPRIAPSIKTTFYTTKPARATFTTTSHKMSSENNPNPSEQPGLIHGHAKYAQGAVESTIGTATSSQPWQSSGESNKSAGIDEMRKAREETQQNQQQQAPQQGVTGNVGAKAEELAGKAVGCEGMEKEGGQSKSG